MVGLRLVLINLSYLFFLFFLTLSLSSCTNSAPKINSIHLNSSSTPINNDAPKIISVSTTTPDGFYKADSPIYINVKFSKNILVVKDVNGGIGDIILFLNSTSLSPLAAKASFYASSNDTITLKYVVQSNEYTTRLNYPTTNSFQLLNGATIRDESDKDANLQLPDLCPMAGLCSNLVSETNTAIQSNIVIDTKKPSDAVINSFASTINVITESPLLMVTANDLESGISYFKVKIYNSLDSVFANPVGFNDSFHSGNKLTGLNLTHGQRYLFMVNAVDKAGNVSEVPVLSSPWAIDIVPPTIISMSTTKLTGYYKTGTEIDISVDFSEPVKVTGVPYLLLNASSGNTAKANFLSGNNTNTLIFRYIVASGEMSSSLNYQSSSSLFLNSGIIKDESGNAAILNLPAGSNNQLLAKNINIDTTPPSSVNSFNVNGGGWSKLLTQSPSFSFSSVADTGSGVARYEVKVVSVASGLAISEFRSKSSGNSFTTSTPDFMSPLVNGNIYKFVIRAVDLAENYSAEFSSASWRVDNEPPTVLGSITNGLVPANYTRQSPTFQFTPSIDNLSGIAGYYIQIRKKNEPTVVVVPYTTLSFNSSNGTYYYNNSASDVLVPGEAYFAKIVAGDVAGNMSIVSDSLPWIALVCPNNAGGEGLFVLVPPVAPYTERAFCVSQFEMKGRDNSGNPIDDGTKISNPNSNNSMAQSRASGTPWVNIKRLDAATKCQSISINPGFNLINNRQWQTIAQNIELNGMNWTSGVRGVDMLFRGHSDSFPSFGLSVSNTTDNYNQTSNSKDDFLGGGLEQRRTLLIKNDNFSNPSVIWDFSGNVAEWINNSNNVDFGIANYIIDLSNSGSNSYSFDGLTGNAKLHFGSSGTYSNTLPQYGSFGYANLMLTPHFDRDGITRGGNWNDSDLAGLFNINFDVSALSELGQVGFRCVYAP